MAATSLVSQLEEELDNVREMVEIWEASDRTRPGVKLHLCVQYARMESFARALYLVTGRDYYHMFESDFGDRRVELMDGSAQ